MALPSSPADKNWPKGPNFLGIVIAFAVAILIILGVAVYLVHGRAQKMIPAKTETTPSQTMVLQNTDLSEA